MRLRRLEKKCLNVPEHTDRPNRKGMVLIWAALLLMFLILLFGLAFDTANVCWQTHKLQNAADAAALAGALSVKTDHSKARADACDTAYANYANKNHVSLDLNIGNDPNGDIVLGNWFWDTRTFVPIVNPGDYANAVKAVAGCGAPHQNNDVNLIFGPIVGIDSITVSRDAVAVCAGGTGAGLLALSCGAQCESSPSPCGSECSGPPHEGYPGLEMVGGSVIDVACGAEPAEVVVNCESCEHPEGAVEIANNAHIDGAAQMNVVGCYDGPETDYPISQDDPCNFEPDPLGCWPDGECLMPQLGPDPANDLSPAPCEPWEPDPNTIDINAPDPCYVLSPGYYSGGINITSAQYPVYFQPGIYVLDGEICGNINATGGLKLTGGIIDASAGVMFYILGGPVDIGGNAQLSAHELVPWNADDGEILLYEGMLIYQDPDNCTPARIIGTSSFDLVGTIYFPFNHVEIGGSGYAVGSQLIANSVDAHTSGTGVCIAYDGRYRAQGVRSYLVK